MQAWCGERRQARHVRARSPMYVAGKEKRTVDGMVCPPNASREPPHKACRKNNSHDQSPRHCNMCKPGMLEATVHTGGQILADSGLCLGRRTGSSTVVVEQWASSGVGRPAYAHPHIGRPRAQYSHCLRPISTPYCKSRRISISLRYSSEAPVASPPPAVAQRGLT